MRNLNVLAVWWHCLWRMTKPGHRWISLKVQHDWTEHFCECCYKDRKGLAAIVSRCFP